MLIEVKDDYRAVSQTAARVVADAIQEKAKLRIGLAAGETPLGLYQELIRLHRHEDLDFSKIELFALDEYVGIPPQHPDSFHAFLHRHFLDQVNATMDHIHLLDGSPRSDYVSYCRQYEQTIRSCGGIDLQILGIGRNGHIGFNEPGSSFGSRTRRVTLSPETVEDNTKLLTSDEMPSYALTLGIGTILDARKILLLASGAGKAHVVAQALQGPLTVSVPASALQLHRDVLVLLDAEAAADLRESNTMTF